MSNHLFYGGPVHGSFRELSDTYGPVHIAVSLPSVAWMHAEDVPLHISTNKITYYPHPNFQGGITYVAEGWLDKYVKQQIDFIDGILSRHYVEIKDLERIKFRLEHAR